MTFRVITKEDDIRKANLPDSFESILQFQSALAAKLNITKEFTILYADPEFGNDFGNLHF